ncbi:biotin carboxylase [Kitasatospora sp. MAP12-15]|uniref:ATP-grasp domain-containing protein n=1 Tax=unclassified Kitasatospora TaxID=2633591 RepID=UPI002473357F|nr:ATP-grasp domain-containing protein [Kitasatospora sp. MAP12-44]MDH6114552.1 biotin carboxylase [Kitasatospora sp. MAP12-44]
MHLAVVDCNPAALQAIRLAKEAGHRVTFLQPALTLYTLTGENLRIVQSVDRLIDQVATTDPQAVLAALTACHAEEPIDAAVTYQEMAAESVAEACRALGLRGTAAEAVFTARRKDLCRAALERAGLASARYALAADAEEALAAAERIGYPVVLKPPSGSASLLSHVAHDATQAATAIADVLAGVAALPGHWQGQFSRGVLVEELLVGRLVSVEIGARDGEFFPFCVSGRFRWHANEVVELGSCIPADLSPADTEACVAYAQEVCRAIGADLGVFHLEVMVTERGPVLVEFNPRVMGGGLPSAYRHATGQDIYTSLLQLLSGAPVDVPQGFADCTAVFAVIAQDGGRLSPTADLAALTGHPDVLEVIGFDAYRTGPGQPIAPAQAVARFILRAPDRPTAAHRAEELLHHLEHSLGLPLMTGDLTRD